MSYYRQNPHTVHQSLSDRSRRPALGAQRQRSDANDSALGRSSGSQRAIGSPAVVRPALTEHRFQDLLQDASRFFAQAEEDIQSARQAAIDEILVTMNRYGLTTDDLV